MAVTSFKQPADYTPPSSAVELKKRYEAGDRFFVGASLQNAQLSNTNLEDANLSNANLFRADLSHANLRNAILDNANMRESSLFYACLASSQILNADLYDCRLCDADLSRSKLCGTNFWCADLDGANFTDADLSGVSLRFADLTRARLIRANVTNANLIGAQLVDTVLDGADISGSCVYGVSAWSVSLKATTQRGLIITDITDDNQSTVTVDDLEVAQFVHLLLRNQNLRKVIETVTSKMVLILGRFTDERKAVLKIIKRRLDEAGYLAVIFDFDKPRSRNLTETVKTLAHLAKFIIADLTDPSSVPHELMAVVPFLPSVGVKPILDKNHKPYSMFADFKPYTWVLPVWRYTDLEAVEQGVLTEIIGPLEEWGHGKKNV